MKLPRGVNVVSLLLLAVPSLVFAAETHRVFLGSGFTGTSQYGFRGGWGLSAGAELPIARSASFLVRADHHVVPDAGGGSVDYPGPVFFPLETSETAELGRAADVETASLTSAMVGLRLHPASGRFRSYADVLVGVGHLRDGRYVPSREGNGGGTLETRDDTNLAMSVGGGLRWVPGGAGSLFLDAHYDFYFVPGFDTPVIPVRLGISHP